MTLRKLGYRFNSYRAHTMKIHVFRLVPGQDLRQEIDAFVAKKKIKAGVIISCVGNLKKATLRMANANFTKEFNDNDTYEIVSLVGTCEVGNSHLHIAISDVGGKVFGGHVKLGCVVGITAEVVIGELSKTRFLRKFDKSTGYNELVVKRG